MPRPIRLALCQVNSAPEIAANTEKLQQYVASASQDHHANIVIFPEFFTQGIVADSPEKIFHDDNETKDYIAGLAKQFKIDIVCGTLVEKVKHEKSSAREHKTFNTAYYFGKDGSIKGHYRKRNLWHPEKDYLHPGEDDHLVFDTDYCKTGMLVCWDLAWPEAFRALLVQGVELVIVPTYWVADDVGDEGKIHDPEFAGEKSWLDSLVITRAYENECVVAFVNCGGPAKDGFLGRSAVAAPFKGCIARIEDSKESMKIVDVDLDVIADARKVYQIRKDYDLAKDKNFGHPQLDNEQES